MVNLMQAEGDRPDGGGANWRHRNLRSAKVLKPQFKDLAILQWIQENLPCETITGIHCVSIEPGGFAAIHRDGGWKLDEPNPARANGFYRQGFVVVTLNISNGGVPLLWALDHETRSPRSADTDCYMISDYFMHAVPLTQSRRRQIRVSMVPNAALSAMMLTDQAVILPDDYEFTW